ncbi:MAG: sigma-70 family RNA polymerase sigma factor [Cyanobacteria bacterium J06638_22]
MENSMAETDADLVQLLRQGQTAALGKLYDRYSGLVYGIALKMLTNAAEAEDLTQEIFLILWQRDTYQASRGSMGSYLSTLTRSRALDRLRVGSNRQRILNQWSDDVGPRNTTATPFEQASIEERKAYVRKGLADLPEKNRQVLELMYFEGLSQSQIAQRLDTPLGTVKTWARKGLLQLNQSLKSLQES